MNRKIKTYRAITYIVLFYLAAACFLLGPGGVLKKDRLVAGNETAAGTAEVRQDRQIQQVFIAEGTYLKYLDVYVTGEGSAWCVYRLRVYNDQNELLLNREIQMIQEDIPGFWRIPLSIETEPGRIYFWQLQGTNRPLELAYENTGETGLTTYGNYYVLENGESMMQEAQNIVMRLVYTDSPSVKKTAVLYAGLILLAAGLIAAAEYAGAKRQKLKKSVKLQTVIGLTFGIALAAAVLYLVYVIFVKDQFGGTAADKIVYGLGISLTAVFLGWVILAKRRKKKGSPLSVLVKQHGMDWLQSAAFAGALWGCIHYMNALYQVWQDLAYREVLVWSGLVLVTMGTAKELFNKKNAAWIVVSGLAGSGYYLYRKAGMTQEQPELTLKLIRDDVLIVVTAGLVAIVLIGKLRSFLEKCKKQNFSAAEGIGLGIKRINRFYAAVLTVFLVLLVAFRNTRGWTIYLAVVFGLFYLFYLGWENRDRLLANFGNGVMLNFALACVFVFARRPYRAWIYNRYNFVFHTVTITATYLTLVVCVMTVRLLMKLKEGERLTDLWGTLLLYGFSMSFLFLTLSRTGYLAVIVMTAVVVPFATFFCYRQGLGAFLKNLACMGLSALLCLPVVYTGVRILPAIYNDPYIYEVEEGASAVYKDEPKNSENYMSVSYFKYVMEEKLFADASVDREDAKMLMLCMTHTLRRDDSLYVKPRTVLAASEADLSAGEDFSNGRFEIYRCYIEEWNLTGHEEMGVVLPDGSISVHAHNTYLQVIHDHGLITGAVYLLLGVVSICLMFVFAVKKIREDAWAILPLAVFIGFAVASLVEWLFHPCNPMGFSMMVIFAPLLQFWPGEKGPRK